MKLHPPTTILVLLAVALATMTISSDGSEVSNVGSSEDNRVECEVARAYISLVFADGNAFPGDEPIHMVTERVRGEDIETFLASPNTPPSARANPLIPLIIELEKRGDEHILDVCPDILDINARLRKDDPDDEPVVKPDGYYDRIYFGLSVPAVSEDSKQALLVAGYTYAGEAGGGEQILMQKDGKGRWQIAFSQRTWIS